MQSKWCRIWKLRCSRRRNKSNLLSSLSRKMRKKISLRRGDAYLVSVLNGNLMKKRTSRQSEKTAWSAIPKRKKKSS